MCKQMATRAQAVAQTLAIAPTILVTRRELDAVVCGETPARLLAGWRQQVLAPMLADFGAADGALLWEV